MLLVQEFLLTHSIPELKDAHGVNARVQDYKACFAYDQIESKETDPLACECRQLILAKPDGSTFPTEGVVGETMVIGRSFDRFFNLGQGCAANVDFNDPALRIATKLDGSLIACYYDTITKKWCVATRSVPEANLPIDGGNSCNGSDGVTTFRTLFERALRESPTTKANYSTLEDFGWMLNKQYTYLFELCTPLNVVVVQHNDFRFWWLGCRDTKTGQECNIENTVMPIAPVLHHGPISLETCLELVNSKNGKEFEGVVAVDSQFRRVKIKNAAYIAIHHITDSVKASPRNLATVVLNGQADDIASYLPEYWQKELERIRENIATVSVKHNKFVDEYLGVLTDRKTYALKAQEFPELNMGYLMDCFAKGRKTYAEWTNTKRHPVTKTYPDALLDQLTRLS